MIVHGLILTDPSRPPTPGWLRVHAGRIAEILDVIREIADRSDLLALVGQLAEAGLAKVA